MTSVIVVGEGLAGLFAATLAARRGAGVRLVAQGRGGLSLSHGCVDVWRDGDARFSTGRMGTHHPLTVAGRQALEAGLSEFARITAEAALPYVDHFEQGLHLPTSVGTIHHTAAAPVGLAYGNLRDRTPFHLGDIAGLSDFSAGLAAAGMRQRGLPVAGAVSLPLPPGPVRDRVEPLALARRLEDPGYRAQVIDLWRSHLHGAHRLGLPAVLGLERSTEVLDAVRSGLAVDVFEIPTLPPCIPGLRLERALRGAALRSGVEFIEGPSVRGEVDGRSGGRRVSGVVTTTPGGPRRFKADAVLLATGGPLHGGWLSFRNAEIQDSVFGLPIESPESRDRWVDPDPFQTQPYARFGLQVDRASRPADARGRAYFENLYAAGGILGGADRTIEGSRQGIDLATGYAAVEALLR